MYYVTEQSRISYDGLYNLIQVIIMTSIVAGIIIDTFGALRAEENEKMWDIQNKCFICGIPK